MLRLFSATLRDCTRKAIGVNLLDSAYASRNHIFAQARCLSSIIKPFQWQNNLTVESSSTGGNILSDSLKKLLVAKPLLPTVPCRTVTKFSLRKGKHKSVKTVLKRFYRLNWGMWIRTKAGRHKRLWKKSSARRRRLRQHVFTTSTQSWMLDKMVTKFWKRPKYFVDNPYEPYHTREEFRFTQKKPKPLQE